MRYCNNCFMPDTKPGLVLDEDGICQACRHTEAKKKIDYDKRFEQLKQLCNKYKRGDGYYDCVIAVSGGKDSHYEIYVMKELLHMNPLLVSLVDPFTHTKGGEHNFKNMGDAFNCDTIALHLSSNLVRRMMRIAFEEFGSPNWPIDRAICTFPIHMAIRFGIKLVVYGENVSYEYGGALEDEDTYSAKDQIDNDVVKEIDWEFWYSKGISKNEVSMLMYPSEAEIEKAGLEPMYLSYFVNWNGERNYEIAKRYGFRDISHEWKRNGFIEDYDGIDSIGYQVHPWLKYPKFGFGRATDVVGYWRRSGKITKEKALKLLEKNDNVMVDQKALDDFLQFTGYTDREFWSIVERFWNRDVFEKVDGVWKKKRNVWDDYDI